MCKGPEAETGCVHRDSGKQCGRAQEATCTGEMRERDLESSRGFWEKVNPHTAALTDPSGSARSRETPSEVGVLRSKWTLGMLKLSQQDLLISLI